MLIHGELCSPRDLLALLWTHCYLFSVPRLGGKGLGNSLSLAKPCMSLTPLSLFLAFCCQPPLRGQLSQGPASMVVFPSHSPRIAGHKGTRLSSCSSLPFLLSPKSLLFAAPCPGPYLPSLILIEAWIFCWVVSASSLVSRPLRYHYWLAGWLALLK